MSDLPAPFTIAAYATSDHSTKIKLKKPKPEGTSIVIPVANTTTPGTLLLRVPGQHMAVQASTSASPHPVTKSPKVSTKAVATPKAKQGSVLPATPTTTAAGVGALQPAKFVQATASHYLNASQQPNRAVTANALPNTNSIHPYMKPTHTHATPSTAKTLHLQTHLPPAPAATPTPTPVPAPTPVYRPPIAPLQLATANVTSQRTPTPVTPVNGRQLRFVSLRIRPSERLIELDQKYGVRIWALRLSHADTSIYISDVKFLTGAEEEEEESDEDAEVEAQEEEEEEENEGEPEKPSRRTRGRSKRGAKPQGKDVKGKGKAVVSTKKSSEEVQVKLNGIAVKGTHAAGKKDTGWTIELGTGSNLVEVGEKNGPGWKVYLERPAAT